MTGKGNKAREKFVAVFIKGNNWRLINRCISSGEHGMNHTKPPCKDKAILCFLIKDLLCLEHDSYVASTNETFKAIHLLISCYFYSTTKNEVNPTRAQERVKSTYSQNLSSGNFFRL